MAEKETKPAVKVEKMERIYTIPLREEVARVARYKRANKAIKAIKEFLVRHMKVRDRDLDKIRLDKQLNEFIWSRGIRSPPRKVKVKVYAEGEIFRAELAEPTESMKFTKSKLERRNQKAMESKTKKAPKKTEEKADKPEGSEGNIEEAKEKKAAVVEAGKAMEKAAAKTMKHSSQDQKKKATTPRRMTMAK